jgi:AmmeMemoRadiSam system protein B
MTVDAKPRLRPLEINAVEENGERFFVLQDQRQLSDESLIVSPSGAWLLQHMNGEKTREEILTEFQAETDQNLPPEQLDELIDRLDEHFLLENERSRQRMTNLVDDFQEKDVREATLPGRSVPADSAELRSFLDDTVPQVEGSKDPSRGLVVPHIDYVRGKEAYAEVLPYLRGIPDDVERIIVLGISHYTCPVPFSLTEKTFASPFGDVSTDPEALQTLADSLPYDPKEGEIAHRLEHSIEIPLLLLQYAQPDLDVDLVPIICSFRREDEHEKVLGSISDELTRLLDDPATYLIAGVDFAHMGPEFGDPEPLEESDFESLEHHDREMLKQLERADAGEFEHHIQTDGNRRRVCGYPALRTLLPLFDQGDTIHYDQWQDPRETVTYGSLVMQ